MPTAPSRHLGNEVPEELAPLPTGRSVIVVIGIDSYAHHTRLTNAVNDARAALHLFQRCGFEELPGAVSLFDEQATLGALTSLVRDQLPHELQPDDSLVLFYAGHGGTAERSAPNPQDARRTIVHRTGYLTPVDARPQKSSDWLRLDTFLDDLALLPARHVLVILDACESGFALSEKFKFRGGGQGGTIAELAGRVSRRVVTSAMHDQKAMDGGGGGGNSLFTETLVDAVANQRADRDGDGYVTTTALFEYVRQQVSDTANRVHSVRQTPDYGQLAGDGSGELVLSLRGDTYNRLRADETLKVADAIYQLGWLSGDTKRFASAVRHYTAAYDLATLGKMALPAARLGLGKALWAAGQVDEAAVVLDQLVQDEGEVAASETQFYLGLVHAKRQDYARAAQALREWHRQHADGLDSAWIEAYIAWLGHAAQPTAGRKRALLVGINQYRQPGFQRLAGSVNNVKRLMKPALIAHGTLKADDVTILTDSLATKARFVEEIRRFKNTSSLSDAVVVYFSGLGLRSDGTYRDLHGDQYLALHDTTYQPGQIENSLGVNELHELMQDIPAGRKTLILDTHSNQKLIELAQREGSYALILASDTAGMSYDGTMDVEGEGVRCGMLTGALYQSLLNADAQTLTYGEWIAAAIQAAAKAMSNRNRYPQRQTPYFIGIKSQRVFGTDDIYLSTFEFGQRHDWPELPLEELTKLYAIFCHAITVPHPHGHAAFGRAFLTKNAHDQAIQALRTAVAQMGDAAAAPLLSLTQAYLRMGQYQAAVATSQRHAALAALANQATAQEVTRLLEQLAAGRRHALLVGIDQYQAEGAPRLQGAANDVAALRRLLTQRWGFQAEDIAELVDASATRAAILAGFQRLADVAQREPALFFFAGLGSHDQDRLPTIVPCDGRQGDVPDIALEELAGFVDKDATNLYAVLDAGFSGRTTEPTDRTIAPDHRISTAARRFATDDDRQAFINTLQLGASTITSA